ncbi:MAG: DUF2341 domain-containing protein [Candidatus Cloacimonetes bacterium]|nr:DUF2341 domain-containing protein [Candidatus Cloacimonadota bacterium]
MAQNWYDVDWDHRIRLTIDNAMVAGSGNLTDFPLLINITNDDIKNSAQADGDDILFTSDDGQTKLDHTIEKYVSSTGALTAWVRIPTLSYSADTDIFVYYGNATASNQQNTTGGVWNSGYKMVLHLSENPAGTAPQFKDQTSNSNSGTTSNMESGDQVSAKINGGVAFDGVNENANCGNVSGLGSAVTVSLWFKTTNNLAMEMVTKALNSGNWTGFCLRAWAPGQLNFRVYNSTGGDYHALYSMVFADGNWHHMVGTYDGSNVRLYVNGEQRASGALTGSISNNQSLLVGGNLSEWTGGYFNGTLDQIQISSVARSADWIKTQYRNQNSASYITVDEEEDPLPISLSSFTATFTAEYFVTLKWITESETNCLGYYIYRGRSNLFGYSEIITPLIQAHNTVNQQVYTYTDSEIPEEGTYYYWLQNVDFDGVWNIHGPVMVNVFQNTDDPNAPEIPITTSLNTIYPNPFNPVTYIKYSITEDLPVRLDIYNSKGQLVRTLTDTPPPGYIGYRSVVWNGLDHSGMSCSSGIYLIRMTAGKHHSMKKVMLVK